MVLRKGPRLAFVGTHVLRYLGGLEAGRLVEGCDR